MTAALEVGEWSAARPGRTLPRERPTHCTGGWVGLKADLDGRKNSSLPGFFWSYNFIVPSVHKYDSWMEDSSVI